MNPYEYLKDATADVPLTEWAMSAKGRAFMDRAQMRQDLRELERRSDRDILRAVLEVKL